MTDFPQAWNTHHLVPGSQAEEAHTDGTAHRTAHEITFHGRGYPPEAEDCCPGRTVNPGVAEHRSWASRATDPGGRRWDALAGR